MTVIRLLKMQYSVQSSAGLHLNVLSSDQEDLDMSVGIRKAMSPEQIGSLLAFILVCCVDLSKGDCTGPQMMLVSDDHRRTCTDISASKYRIEYSCASLIKGFERAMIKYCPVELCMDNGQWSKPSISCALSECYKRDLSFEYMGHRTCTVSGRQCQRWDAQEPNRHRFRQNEMFPDFSVNVAEAFCRDPEGAKGSPWCFTADPERKWEFCDIKECSSMFLSDGSCGPKFDPSPDWTTGGSFHSSTLPTAFVPVSPTDDHILKECHNDLEFHVNANYRIQGQGHEVAVDTQQHMRSAVECATWCTHAAKCRAFTFHAADNTCELYNGSNYELVKQKGYKSGFKDCLVL